MTEQEVFIGALELLGPGGENWIKGADTHTSTEAKTYYCAGGAINTISAKDCTFLEKFRQILRVDFVSQWNDAPERTFPEVKEAFEKVIASC